MQGIRISHFRDLKSLPEFEFSWSKIIVVQFFVFKKSDAKVPKFDDPCHRPEICEI